MEFAMSAKKKKINKMIGKLIVFSAPSGSGKTTIVQELLKDKSFNLEFSVSATSRKPRDKELNGKDYYFLTADDFKSKIADSQFVEWEEVYANQFYGTLKTEVKRIRDKGNSVIFDIDVLGGINIKKQFKNECLTIFIKAPSLKELEKRLRNRGTESEENINKRLSKAEKELTYSNKFDVVIVNDILENAVAQVKKEIKEFLNKK